MCEQVAELVALDYRHIRHSVAEYLAPNENEYGRFPDIYVEWEGFGPFAVEFQMSGTFQTEISARCKHYEREGIPLLWILFGIDPAQTLSQSFRDVIRRHRGNAFVLDPAAVAASREQKTLLLSCYLKDSERLVGPKLVRFDQLTIPRSKIPYWEDRIVAPLLMEIESRRRPWFQRLNGWDRENPFNDLNRQQSVLLAAAFSIFEAANGRMINYASKHQNIKAMLNTYLHGGTLAVYADLLTQLIKNTAVGNLRQTTVGKHLQDYRAEVQADVKSLEGQLLRSLLPEALDPVIREELSYFDALPDWARTSNQGSIHALT